MLRPAPPPNFYFNLNNFIFRNKYFSFTACTNQNICLKFAAAKLIKSIFAGQFILGKPATALRKQINKKYINH